jgi:hypothetical protein
MSKISRALALILWCLLLCLAAREAPAQETSRDLRASLAKEFEGVYRFNYLFAENGAIYLDESSHRQLLDFDKAESDGAPRVTFFNETSKGEKRAHYSYVFYYDGNKLTLREFDGNGKFRFDCVGAYQPEKRTLECEAPRAPKPARDTDSPTTRKIGLFKRPTSWPPYEFLNRRNIFRFYDWGFVNLQENLKLDAEGKTIARESGLITAVKIKPSRDWRR